MPRHEGCKCQGQYGGEGHGRAQEKDPPGPREQPASAATPQYKASAWANVNGHGDYNQLHAHPRNHWAVVYYVAVTYFFLLLSTKTLEAKRWQ